MAVKEDRKRHSIYFIPNFNVFEEEDFEFFNIYCLVMKSKRTRMELRNKDYLHLISIVLLYRKGIII